MPDILVVAATEPELCGRSGLVCGIGPVEAAAATARALAGTRPDAVLHVGLAGGRGLPAGTLVAGDESVYCDLAAAIPVTRTLRPDARLLAAARALPDVRVAAIGTSAAVGALAGGGPDVEAMEGFGVLRACALAGVPALEVRAISNEIGERDRTRWLLGEALEALARALPDLAASVTAALSGSG